LAYFADRFAVVVTPSHNCLLEITEAWEDAVEKCAENYIPQRGRTLEQVCDDHITSLGWNTAPQYWDPVEYMALHIPEFVCLMMMLDNPGDRI